MTIPISSNTRGLDSVTRSRSYLGRYGRMFRKLPALSVWNEQKYSELAKSMTSVDPQIPNKGNENHRIPAGYTYLGQFVNHDITFDPISVIGEKIDPNGLHNFRTPRFDLDSLYGGGPVKSPFLYDGIKSPFFPANEILEYQFRIEHLIKFDGNPSTNDFSGDLLKEFDLPRVYGVRENQYERTRALICDPRNDENIIISQLHLAFLMFHNRAVEVLKNKKTPNPNNFFEAQKQLRWMYQWIVVNDYLPRVVGQGIVNDILENGRRFYDWKKQPFMPVEFSVAAFRFGHSMVRPFYRINDEQCDIPIFDLGKESLSFFGNIDSNEFKLNRIKDSEMVRSMKGFEQRPEGWIIKWERFFEKNKDVVVKDEKGNIFPQPSRKIDTKLAFNLTNLPTESFNRSSMEQLSSDLRQANCNSQINLSSLAVRNLLRGDTLQLPSGQSIARAMDISKDLILDVDDCRMKEVKKIGCGAETPLWYYILKEAEELNGGYCLGPVGGRIVAEVLIGLFEGDPNSYFNHHPSWTPKDSIFKDEITGDLESFSMYDFLKIADPKNQHLEDRKIVQL